MPSFVALVDYTTQGVENLKESPSRSDAFVQMAASKGATVKDIFWTTGKHDGIVILDAPDEAVATSVVLELASAGNVRTQTMRAYNRAEFESILP